MTAQSILTALPGMAPVFVMTVAREFYSAGLGAPRTIRAILTDHMNAKGNPRAEHALRFIESFIAPIGLDEVWHHLDGERSIHVNAMLVAAASVARQVIEIEKSRAWIARKGAVAA